MQMGSNNNGYRSLSVKAVGISAAVVSAGVMLHYTSGPSIFFGFASSEIPNLYRSLISWLTPPYHYFVINGIIISIAAFSRFHKSSSSSGSHSQSQLLDHHHHNVFESPCVSSVPTLVTKQQQEYSVASAPPPVVVEEEVNVGYVLPAVATADEEVKNSDDEKEEFEEEFVMSRSSWAPNKTESVTAAEGTTDYKEKDQSQILTDYSFLTEKPLVSSRLGRRKSLKATPEGGRTLRVSRPKRNDTLESTWRAITDGRAVPLTRHLKKSDTWETHRHTQQQQQPEAEPVVMRKCETFMRKCETFTERDGERGARRPPLSSGAASRLRKEPSIGQDDLNRRVEAFINKFNQEMKLQRQESFKHYLDMINRGSH